jgi:hypothetical protein
MPSIRPGSKDTSKLRSYPSANTKITLNSYNGSKDITISTVEIGENNIMPFKGEEVLQLTLALLKKTL